MTIGYSCLAHLKWFQFSQHLSLGMQMEHLKKHLNSSIKFIPFTPKKWVYLPLYLLIFVTHKNEMTYNRMFIKLLELGPGLTPSYTMVDFEKAAINAFEE